jgi:hypothetical protein
MQDEREMASTALKAKAEPANPAPHTTTSPNRPARPDLDLRYLFQEEDPVPYDSWDWLD